MVQLSVPTQVVPPAVKPGEETLADLFKAKEGEWECDVCLIRNNPGTVKCAACETPKPGIELQSEKITSSAGGDVKMTSGGGFTFKGSAFTGGSNFSGCFGSTSAVKESNNSNSSSGGFVFGGSTKAAENAQPDGNSFAGCFGSTSAVKDSYISSSSSGGFVFGGGAKAAEIAQPDGNSFAGCFGSASTTVSSSTTSGFVFGGLGATSKADMSTKPVSDFSFVAAAMPVASSSTPESGEFNFRAPKFSIGSSRVDPSGTAGQPDQGFNFAAFATPTKTPLSGTSVSTATGSYQKAPDSTSTLQKGFDFVASAASSTFNFTPVKVETMKSPAKSPLWSQVTTVPRILCQQGG